MKNLILGIFLPASAWATLALATLCSLQNSNAQTAADSVAPETAAQSATPVTPPPDISPTSPLAQVVRLTQAGVDQSVIMNYVTGSGSTFNLDSDKIIYLSDLGVPKDVVNAMMQRDQQLQQQFTANQAVQQAQQTQQPQPVPATAPASPPEVTAQPETPPAPVTVNYFYDSLSPYGNWVVINGYGRCWRPTAVVYDSSWQPYCDHGHWVYSDCGWYWTSDYAWGATFHYGRWFRDTSFGWCWYPDTVWAPSWVTWRYSDNYCGWAPLPPGTAYRTGVGIVYNGGSVSVGFSFGLAASCFTFVPTQNFCDPHPHNYRVAPTQVTQIYNNTTVINNYNFNNHAVFNHGIPVQNIATATRTTIHPVPVREINNSPGAYGRTGYAQGANRPALTGNSSPQSFAATQNHYQQTAAQNSQPEHNWTSTQTTQPAHENTGATIPQHAPAAASYHSPAPAAPVQAPAPNYRQQPAPARWQDSQPTGTPRSFTRYPAAQQNYSESSSSQWQTGGNHNGNQSGQGH